MSLLCEVVLSGDYITPLEDFLLCLWCFSSYSSRFVRIFLVSGNGMLLYRFVISREATDWCGSSGVSLILRNTPCFFFILKALGSGAKRWIFSVNSFYSLYAGAFLQFITGRIGCCGLCILIRPLIEGAEGFMFVYFHLVSFGIRVLLSLIVCLTWTWNVLVGSAVAVRKLLLSMKFCILVSYWRVGSMTMEFPLSARVIIALLSYSLVWTELITFVSGCVWWEGLCTISVLMQSATSFLYTSLSVVGSWVMTVSAYRVRFWIQFLCLDCMLYFRPFWSRVISLLVKEMLELLIILG